MLKQYSVRPLLADIPVATRRVRDIDAGFVVSRFNPSLRETRYSLVNEETLNESKVGVNGNVAVVRLVGRRHVDLDQGVHAVDGATFEDLLRR